MQGDDLAIFGILWGTALAFALAAIAMVDSCRKRLLIALWGIAAVFLCAALAWPWLSWRWPVLKGFLAGIANNTFALQVLGLAIFALFALDFAYRSGLIGRRKKEIPANSSDGAIEHFQKSVLPLVNQLTTRQKNLEIEVGRAFSELKKAGELETTVFLMCRAILFQERIDQFRHFLAIAPKHPERPIDTNEKIEAETNRINEYLRALGQIFSGTGWAVEINRVVRSAAAEADQDLVKMGAPPDGIEPYKFRLFHIACLSRDRIESFLDDTAKEFGKTLHSLFSDLRERPELHRGDRSNLV